MKKVSILSPCYNVAKYLPTYFDSIIAQKYEPIELILVDDGSTDNTAEVIKSYKEELQRHNIDLKYIHKENGGQASAVALGIKEVTGDYLIWPDPDDFLLEDSILKRVQYMEENLDCGIVRSNGYVYYENDLNTSVSYVSKLSRTTTIEDFARFSVPWCNGCFMIRMSCFDFANKNREITISKAGQNIQILLPVVFYYPCHYLDEFLFGYVIHSKSHSHSMDSYEKGQEHLYNLQKCVEDTLNIVSDDASEYLEINRKFFRFSYYRNAWNYNNKQDMLKYELELKEHKEFVLEALIMKYLRKTRFSEFCIKVVSKIKRMLKQQ